jgi:phage shock protein PspC (stress-responsive transcriptional regulator)
MTSTDTTAPPPPAPSGPERRRLYRSTDDKVIAGVASGLADHFNVDPLFFRIGFLALIFAGGAGLLLYLIAWVLMPRRHGGPSAGEHAIRRVRSGAPTWIAIVLLVIGVGLLVDQIGVGRPDLVWGGVLIALGVLLFHHATTRSDEPVASSAGSSTATLPLPGAGAGAPPPPGVAAWTERPAYVPRRRQRSKLGWATIGTLFLAIGVAILVDDSGAVSMSLAQYFALALVILAGGLVVGAWVGRARWLVVPALALVPAMVFASIVIVPLRGGFGERLFQPVSAVDASHPYRLIAGRMTIDLSQVSAERQSINVTASIVAGEMHVIVPRGVPVDVHVRVGAGEMKIFGRLSNGLRLEQRITPPRDGPNTVHLDLAVSLGQIVVGR